MYPLDYARALSPSGGARTTASRQFLGTGQTLLRALQTNGFDAIYRGFGISAISEFMYRGAYFGLYDTGKAFLFKEHENDYFASLFAFALATTTVAGLVTYPIDAVRMRFMIDAGKSEIKYGDVIEEFNKIKSLKTFRIHYRTISSATSRGTGGALALALYSKVPQWLGWKQPLE